MIIERVEQVTEELVGAFERLIPQLSPSQVPPVVEELHEIIASECNTLFTARTELGGAIAGVLTLVTFRTPGGKHAWIEDVVVDEAVRGRGAGAALVEAALHHASRLGAAKVYLTSNPARQAANRLYQKMGFLRRETNLYYYPCPEPSKEAEVV